MAILCIDPISSLFDFAKMVKRKGYPLVLVYSQEYSCLPKTSKKTKTILLKKNISVEVVLEIVKKYKIQYCFTDNPDAFGIVKVVNCVLLEASFVQIKPIKAIDSVYNNKIKLIDYLNKSAPSYALKPYNVIADSKQLNDFFVEVGPGVPVVVRPEYSNNCGSATILNSSEIVSDKKFIELFDDNKKLLAHVYHPGCSFFINGNAYLDGGIIFDVWRCLVSFFPKKIMLNSVLEERFDKCREFWIRQKVQRLLKLVGIHHGPFHLEVLIHGNCFKVIKVLPRLAGFPFSIFYSNRVCLGQLDYCYFGALNQFAHPPESDSSFNRKYSTDYSFINNKAGVYQDHKHKAEIETLPSFGSYLCKPKVGEVLDLAKTEEGHLTVLLTHHSAKQLQQDVLTCHAFQQDGLFILQ